MEISLKAVIMALALTLIAVTAHGQPPYPPLDYPHTDAEDVQCTDCHTASNIDEVGYNRTNCMGYGYW
jgi:hypothetical protein